MANKNYKLEMHGLGWWVMFLDPKIHSWVKVKLLGTYPRMNYTNADNDFRAYVRKHGVKSGK